MSKLIQPISFKALFIFTPLLFVSIGCSETLYSQTIPSVKSSSEKIDYPEIDTALGEKLQPNEEVIAHQITQVIEKSIREQYTAGNALRDAHPKAHGRWVSPPVVIRSINPANHKIYSSLFLCLGMRLISILTAHSSSGFVKHSSKSIKLYLSLNFVPLISFRITPIKLFKCSVGVSEKRSSSLIFLYTFSAIIKYCGISYLLPSSFWLVAYSAF